MTTKKLLSKNDTPKTVLIGALVVIVIAAVIGTYTALIKTDDSKNTEANSMPTTINSASDVDQAAKSIDNDQLSSDLDPSQLDEDLNDLL